MELYHKIYKMNPDLTVYLDNPEQLVEHCDEMLNHLTGARSMDELHEEKIAVLRDFYSVCSFDIQDADFPEPEKKCRYKDLSCRKKQKTYAKAI